MSRDHLNIGGLDGLDPDTEEATVRASVRQLLWAAGHGDRAAYIAVLNATLDHDFRAAGRWLTRFIARQNNPGSK